MTVIRTTPAFSHQLPDAEKSDPCRYVVRVSNDTIDADWDAFLKKAPYGNHVQTSLWGQIKAWQGWDITRIVVTDGQRIVAGAQLLVRKARYVGNVGYVPKGPVVCQQDPHLGELVIQTLREIADRSVRVLIVQPASDGESLAEQLPDWGFRPCPIETAPTATVLVNLESDLDTILARMRKGMRNGIRRSLRRGISVREGTADDLPTFHRLLEATSRRRGFSPYELDYFFQMWRVLGPHGHIQLFLSEYEGETVSAQLVIPFGDTVVAKQIGWSGRHGSLKPNEGLDWATLQWAKSQGYYYYDLGGIEPEAARTILNGQPIPKSFAKTPTAYKLRLGGAVHLFPANFCYIPNPILRSAYHQVGYRIANWRLVQNAVSRFRSS